MSEISRRIEEDKQYAIDTRRTLHRQPEISNGEHETTKFITRELEAMGIPCEHPIKTGVIGTITGGKGPGRTIGLRADIDALPLTEQTGLPFASQHMGVMHACGHDGHAAAFYAQYALDYLFE